MVGVLTRVQRLPFYFDVSYDLHRSLFDDRADVVQVVSKAAHGQTQHLDLCLRPFGSEDRDMSKKVSTGI